MNSDKQMAGTFEILQAISAGKVEIVLGENEKPVGNDQYMTARCVRNEFFTRYEDVIASDNYVEILKLFGEKIVAESEKLDEQIKFLPLLSSENCYPHDYSENIEHQVVAIKKTSLKHSYRTQYHQLEFVTGGFGSYGNARGSAVFCTNLDTGKPSRWERCDIQGVVKPTCMPDWAKEKLAWLKTKEKSKSTDAR